MYHAHVLIYIIWIHRNGYQFWMVVAYQIWVVFLNKKIQRTFAKFSTNTIMLTHCEPLPGSARFVGFWENLPPGICDPL